MQAAFSTAPALHCELYLKIVIPRDHLLPFFGHVWGGRWRPRNGLAATAGAASMTHRSDEILQDDLRNLVRIVSACTLGLWAFAAGLVIGVFLFS